MYICIYLKVSKRPNNLGIETNMQLKGGVQYQRHVLSSNVWSDVTAKESFGGMRLLRRADFNVGAHINTFWRMPCRGALDVASKKALTWDNKHITWFGRWPLIA